LPADPAAGNYTRFGSQPVIDIKSAFPYTPAQNREGADRKMNAGKIC